MFHVEHSISYSSATTEQADYIRNLFENHQKKLDQYIELLLWWNKKINLVSRDVPRETIRKHVEHSLSPTLLSSVKTTGFIIDTGTGGGLPGIPLAIRYPDKDFVLNDIVSKKITACKHMVHQLKLKNIRGDASSIENISIKKNALIISKHAFKIHSLIRMIEGKEWETIVLLKGKKDIEDELQGIPQKLNLQVLDLYPGFNDSFYKGKALIEINKA